MLRTNLSTRPFYNDRAVHVGLGIVCALALAVTAFNLWEVFSLSGLHAQLQSRMTLVDNQAKKLRARAAQIRSSISPRDLDATIAAADEANAIIRLRTFSWTELFNRFESTLPDNVRISSVRPRFDRRGAMTVIVVVVARNVEDVDAFIERLEQDGDFKGLLSREEFVNEEGLLQATLEGQYVKPTTPQPGPARGGTP